MDLINRSGGQYAKFAEVGDTVKGEVLEFYVDDMNEDFNGNPNPCPVVVVETDDGEACIIKLDNGRKRYAAKQALADAKANTIDRGGVFALKFSSEGEAKRGQNPPKLYTAAYKAPEKPAAEAPFADADSLI